MVTPETSKTSERPVRAPDLAGMDHAETNQRLADFFSRVHEQRMVELKASIVSMQQSKQKI